MNFIWPKRKRTPKPQPFSTGFESLSPTAEIPDSEGKVYFDALKSALNDKTIKNIAVTGPYGSGKSSILQSFQQLYPELNFLSISLATFGSAPTSNSEPPSKQPYEVTLDHALIELSILQQILYSEDQRVIPDSRFSRIAGLSPSKLILNVTLILLWLASLTYLFNIALPVRPALINEIIERNHELLTFVNYLTFIAGLFVFAAKSFRIIRRLSIKKLNLGELKLEMDESYKKAILNLHYDELLYFFQVTDYRGVIIEDLDRFRNTEIFSKLRELNTLINNTSARRTSGKAPLVFIYGIKDDLFLLGDRTKFFDFILPVIPVANSSNAGDYLYKLLVNSAIVGSLEQSFVYTIGLYIDDMRLIKNVYNEYKIYRSKVGVDADKKLISIIAYKNLYPKDFSDLHAREGMIFRLFAEKHINVAKLAAPIESQIAAVTKSISELEKEIVLNSKELRIIYLSKLRQLVPDFDRLHTGYSAGVTLQDLESSEQFNRLTTSGRFNYYDRNSRILVSPVSFSEIQQQVNPDLGYLQRLHVVEQKEQQLADLKINLSKSKVDLAQLERSSLEKLLQTHSIEKFSTEISKEPLLIFLLKTGGIDELYNLYISCFYEGILSENDQQFLIAVKTDKTLPPTHKLSNCPEVAKRLSIDDFSKAGILNINIVNYTAKEYTTNPSYFRAILEQLKHAAEPTWQFIDEYRRSSEPSPIVPLISINWPQCWEALSKRYASQEDTLVDHFIWLFKHLSTDHLRKLNLSNSIADFVSNSNKAISRLSELSNHEEVKLLLTEFAVKVTNFHPYENKGWLNQIIIDYRFYILNEGNVTEILSYHKNPHHPELAPSIWSFTSILNANYGQLNEYILAEINDFISRVYIPHFKDRKEEQQGLVYLLNLQSLSFENKQLLLNQPNVIIHDIETIDYRDDLWSYLLANDKLTISWENFLKYFALTLKISTDMAAYLNKDKVFKTLEKQPIRNMAATKDDNDRLQQAIRTANSISKQSYNALIKSVDRSVFVDWTSIDNAKAQLLIWNNKCELTPNSFNSLRTNHPGLESEILIYNFTDYLSSPDDYEISAANSLDILKTKELSDVQKEQILSRMTPDWIASNADLTQALVDFLTTVKVSHVPPLLISALLNSNIQLLAKLNLYTSYSTGTSILNVQNWLDSLGRNFSQLSQEEILLPKDAIDLNLLQTLKEKSYIKSIEIIDTGEARLFIDALK